MLRNALNDRGRRNARGFTLVEILIVVIILGILAAIVIPQFTSASEDARRNSLSAQLQTLRSQVELYKLQHLDENPPDINAPGTVAANVAWSRFLAKTDADHTLALAGKFGPYLQTIPRNPIGNTPLTAGDVFVVAVDPAFPASGAADEGWVFNHVNGKLWATS